MRKIKKRKFLFLILSQMMRTKYLKKKRQDLQRKRPNALSAKESKPKKRKDVLRRKPNVSNANALKPKTQKDVLRRNPHV